MKKVLFIMLIAYLPICSYAFTDIAVWENTIESPQPVDKKTQIRSDMRQAKYMLDRGEYAGAKKLLDRVLKLDPNNKDAKSLLEQCQNKLEEQMKNESNAYQSACEKGTIEALESFISNYPDGYYRQQAKDRITDMQLWDEAQRVASKEAYERYLSQSPLKSHLKEAESQIIILSEDDEWNHCDTKSKTELERFISRHPQSRYVERAKYHLNILKAFDSYQSGDKLVAFSYLDEARNFSPLYDKALQIYNELRDEYMSPKMLISNNIDEVSLYLKDLAPSSNYYNRISNHLAELLSLRFTSSTTSVDVEKALGYAKDETTRNIVLRNAKNKSSKSVNTFEKDNSMQRADFLTWLKNRIFVGIKLDAEKNVYEPSWAFDGGLVLKFGKYTDLLNFHVGADFRFYIFDNYPRKASLAAVAHDSYITGGQIIIPLTIRFNILQISDSWRLYMGGACDIHSKIHDNFHILKDHIVSFEAQSGFVSRHWDIGAHFRKFGRTPYFINCRSNYIGMHASYYL